MTPEDVLKELVADIEAVGTNYLSYELGWPDLYETYLHACEVLNRKPQEVVPQKWESKTNDPKSTP